MSKSIRALCTCSFNHRTAHFPARRERSLSTWGNSCQQRCAKMSLSCYLPRRLPTICCATARVSREVSSSNCKRMHTLQLFAFADIVLTGTPTYAASARNFSTRADCQIRPVEVRFSPRKRDTDRRNTWVSSRTIQIKVHLFIRLPASYRVET